MELKTSLESNGNKSLLLDLKEKKSNIHLVDGSGEPIQLTKDKYITAQAKWFPRW
jgi:hypothetical protein